VQLDWEPTGLAENAAAIVGLDDLQVKRDLAKFKDLIEAQGIENGAWRGDVTRAPDAHGA
jgi:hypothetical protein